MATKKGKILVVDDNAGIRKALEILLPMHFAEVKTIPSPATLVSTLEQFRPDVILLDMNFNTSINTGNEGLYWAGEIKKMAPDVEVVLFTAYADIQLAVEGMKRGAFDFVVKPWENDKLVEVLLAARDKARKAMGRDAKASEARPAEAGAMFWGDSPAMAAIRKTLDKIAPTDATVLITGENGTGKDVLAREIHARSLRNEKAMVAVDAGAITETLFESELFGHVKGAFTDAHTDHEGKFEQADGGTLFLDEIGNIPLHLQAKLLRAIQNRSIVRVGGTEARPVNIRLICATNMDLAALVREGRFREDLFYRINTVHIALPSLRERRDDIVPLAERFLLRFAEKYHRPLTGISHEAASLADFAGARITGQLGTFHYDVIPQIEGVQQMTAMETFPAMITALKAGAIDGYVSERPGAVSAVAANPELTFVAFEAGAGFEASLDDTAVAVALQKGSALVDQINEILATITPEQREELMQWAVDNQPLAE